MTEPRAGADTRQRGEVEVLRSGALRVKVYAGEDPLTGRRKDWLSQAEGVGPSWVGQEYKACQHLQLKLRSQPRREIPPLYLRLQLELNEGGGYVNPADQPT